MTTREKLISAIVDCSSDELDTKDYIAMAGETEDQLLDRLVNILNYYYNAYSQL